MSELLGCDWCGNTYEGKRFLVPEWFVIEGYDPVGSGDAVRDMCSWRCVEEFAKSKRPHAERGGGGT